VRKHFLLLTILGFGYSQATGIAMYGVGERIRNTDPAVIALGNSSFFSGNSNSISNDSPSSLWRSALTRFSIFSGMNYLTTSELPEQHYQNLTSFSLLFPVGNKKVFGFGLRPVSRTNKLDIKDEDFKFIGADKSITGKPIVLKNNYSINGGISELFLEYSRKLSSHYSGGIIYSFLIGNQYLDDELYTYNVVIDTSFSSGFLLGEIPDIEGGDTLYAQAENGVITELNKSRKFSGSILTLEGRYAGSKQEWVVSVSVNSKVKVDTQNIQTANDIIYTNRFGNSSNAILSELGFGYLCQFENNIGVIVEIHKEFPFNIPESAALFNIMPPEENSIHFGSYYQIQNSKIGFWNNINIRVGAYIKELDFTRGNFWDYGATLGLGIEYLGNTQSIDLALRVGKKESIVLDREIEEFISLHLGITTGEKWFMKRRRK